MRRSPIDTGLVMNSVPNDLIVQSCRHTSAHCEYELAIKSLLQQLQHLLPLCSIRQISRSGSSWIVLTISATAMHVVTYDDGSLGVSRNRSMFIDSHVHSPIGLVSSHVSEDRRADGTLRPLFASYHLQQTDLVKFMGAAEHEYIVIELLGVLLLYRFDEVVLQTDHALLVLHVDLAEGELDGVEV